MANGRKIRYPKIIQPGSRRRYWWIVGPLVLLLPLAVWLGSNYERLCPEPDMSGVREEIAILKQQLAALESERAELRQEVARLARASQIDQEAASGLRDEMKKLQDERLELEQEVVFLRRVVSDGSGKGALRIKDFKLSANAEEAMFRYSFVVSQAQERSGTMAGKILISLEGLQEGKSKTLSLKTLSSGKLEFVKMRFKRFQNVAGLIQLPKNFMPTRVLVDIQPEDKEIPPLTKTFDWAIKG